MSVIFVILVIAVNFSIEFEFNTIRAGNLDYNERIVLEQNCGKRFLPSQLQKRSMGGRKVEKGEFPWTILLQIGIQRCSAAMISWRHALTAAHCLIETKVCNESDSAHGTYTPRSTSNLSIPVNTSDGHRDYQVVNITIHNGYNPCNHTNDLALMEVSPHIFHGHAPICMPSNDEDIPKNMTATGYGFNPNVSKANDEAYAVNLTHINVRGYSNIYTATYKATMCEGDSGGPLFKHDGHRYILLGITSSGTTCSGKTRVWVSSFTNVKKYLKWVCDNSGVCAT